MKSILSICIHRRFISVLFISLPLIAVALEIPLITTGLRTLGWAPATILGALAAPNSAPVNISIPVPGKDVTLRARLWRTTNVPPKCLSLIMQGTGSNSEATNGNIIGETVTKQGCDAIVLPNPFSASFQRTFSADGLVGIPQKDIRDTMRMLEATVEWYKNFTHGTPENINLMGISLGALYAVMAMQEKSSVNFSKAIAICPPVELKYGMEQLDNMIRAMVQEFSVYRATPELFNLVVKAVLNGVSEITLNQLQFMLPKDDMTNYQLIGYAFQKELKDITRNLFANPSSFSSNYRYFNVEARIGKITFREFAEILFREMQDKYAMPVANADAYLNELNFIRYLRQLPPEKLNSTFVMTTNNDFLHRRGSPVDDLETIVKTMRDKAYVFDGGGHCGFLWTRAFQETLQLVLQKPVPSKNKQKLISSPGSSTAPTSGQ